MMDMKKVDAFFRAHNTCVLATINASGEPEAATVGFSHNSDFELMIATNESTRKYKNLVNNPHVAVVIGTEGSITVQYQGIARLLEQNELKARIEAHFEKVLGARRHTKEQGQAYFSISPTWLRYSDLKNDEITETRVAKS